MEVVLPRLGWNMEKGIFLGWLKRDGDSVTVGEPLFSVEGDKSIQEIEATESGILRIAVEGPKEGEKIPVGKVLGLIELTAESLRGVRGVPRPLAGVGAPLQGAEASVTTPKGSSSFSEGSRDSAHPSLRLAAPPVTPRSRRAARQLSLPLEGVRGTGKNGRVRERDVLAFLSRQVIAKHPTPDDDAPATLHATADITHLIDLREQFRNVAARNDWPVPTLTDFIVKLAALALRDHPALNARREADAVVAVPEVHVGIAVETDLGFSYPVIRDLHRLSVRRLATHVVGLVERTRAGANAPDELTGGTFTVTDLGPFGVDSFTPTLVRPACATLGIGAVRVEPLFLDDRVVRRQRVTLSLTFDHWAVDPLAAARFLAAVRERVENPWAYLVE